MKRVWYMFADGTSILYTATLDVMALCEDMKKHGIIIVVANDTEGAKSPFFFFIYLFMYKYTFLIKNHVFSG